MMTHLFLSVLEISISVSLIVLVLLAAAPFVNKRYAAKWKYWIWLFLALRLIIPFSGTDVQNVFSALAQRAAQEKVESGRDHAEGAVDGMTLTGRVIVEIPEQMTTPIAVQSEKHDIRITALDVVAMLWMTGGLVCLSVHMFIYLHYKGRLLKKEIPVEDTHLLRRMLKLKRELKIRSTVQVVESPEAASPMIIGLFRPVLILPEEAYSDEELFFILKHELIHLRHRDVYFKLLFVAACAVHWFNPLIWLMQKEAVVDMELYCDESVIQGINYAGRKAYTETLLSTLHRQCAKRTVLSTQFYGGKKIMKKRFKNILSGKGKKNGAVLLLCAIVVTISLGTLIGCSIARGNTGEGTGQLETEGNQSGGAGSRPEMEGNQSGGAGSQPETEGNPSPADGNLAEMGEEQPMSEADPFVQMAGSWIIDFAMTDQTLWGSGISYGDGMEISASGEFRYYIGIGVGGTGQCEINNGVITVEVLPYEENSEGQEILTFNYVNQNGDEYILMDWYGEDVYWRRGEGQTAEETTVLTFMVEGLEEQVPATLVAGDGYSFYLPDDEWQQSDADTWTALVNEQVSIRVGPLDGRTRAQVEEELLGNGYAAIDGRIFRQDGELINGVELKESENDLWGVYYTYPIDSEEGWGRRISVIADTFAVTF